MPENETALLRVKDRPRSGDLPRAASSGRLLPGLDADDRWAAALEGDARDAARTLST